MLTGGELAAMVVIDCVARLGAGSWVPRSPPAGSPTTDGLLQYPQYTRPPEYRGWAVPEVLLSGHHARIDEWRREQSMLETKRRRPDLLESPEEPLHRGADNHESQC